jgi:hypothetical protein
LLDPKLEEQLPLFKVKPLLQEVQEFILVQAVQPLEQLTQLFRCRNCPVGQTQEVPLNVAGG